jgi:GNAT superfamily N-acetyltransferase
MSYIKITRKNIKNEHICCAISDKKCKESYAQKKEWLKEAFDEGYNFLRLDERAKVFVEYGPAEKAWIPINAPNYMNIGCFWVSGKYKKKGHGSDLLEQVIDEAKAQGMDGLVTVTGKKKFHFMSDTKWLKKMGFQVCDSTESGFILLTLKFNEGSLNPSFKSTIKNQESLDQKGLVVYYTNRCPYSEYHVNVSLAETAEKRGLNVKRVKLETIESAQSAPTPATIFSLFYNGEFITTDISVCMDSRFDKTMSKFIED